MGTRMTAPILSDMKDKYRSVYIRRAFQVPPGANPAKIGLAISYDDTFIAYINGREVRSCRGGFRKRQGRERIPLT